jgi:hypothetical protein
METAIESAPEVKPKRKYKTRNSMSDAEKAIRDLRDTHKYVKKDIEKALKSKECSPGTNSRLAYLKALQQLEIDFAETMTKMGVLPKNVAAQTTTSYTFKAHVSKGGNVSTVPVSTPAQMQELERSEAREAKRGYANAPEDDAIRAGFDEQFAGGAAQTESK